MPEISVIVPVFQVQNYLSRCIDSILSQTRQDFELILVDDGSQDDSGKICDDYARKEKRIRVIHQKNSGVSSARNAGIETAQGTFITFVDSDDWLDTSYLEELMKSDAELVCQTAMTLDEFGLAIHRYEIKEERLDVITNQDIERLLLSGVFNWTHGKRFVNKVLQEKNIRFDISVDFGEDTLFVVKYAKAIQSISVQNIANYRYVIYSSRSTLSNSYSLRRFEMIKKANMLICKEIVDSAQINAVYLKRMMPAYVLALQENVYRRRPKSFWREVKYLVHLASDTDFLNLLLMENVYLVPPIMKRAMARGNSIYIVVAYFYCKCAEIKRNLKSKD